MKKEIAVGLVIFSIIGAIILAIVVHLHPVLIMDIRISNEIQESRSISLLPVMQFVSVFGEPLVAICVTIVTSALFYFASYKREAIFTLATFVADGINGLVKLAIYRPRPSDTLVIVYQKLTDPSFPSGHVVHYVVFFGFLVVAMVELKKLPKILRAFLISISLALIVSISVSRIYLGAHWATDVIGGYLVGYVLLSVLLYFYLMKEGKASRP